MLKRQSSINQTIKKCIYVLHPATATTPPINCGNYTNWNMVLDEDNNRVRHYDSFCPRHGGIAAGGSTKK